ncbi:MAG: hypothetical protein O6943_04730 [Bacteroidetes bacterium]|nr:hypothetical protein [Bacteroidota bacterium]
MEKKAILEIFTILFNILTYMTNPKIRKGVLLLGATDVNLDMKPKSHLMVGFIFALAAQVAMGQSSSSGALRINPDNPHYFTYKDVPLVLITDASNLDIGGVGSGFNHKTIINITATGRPNMLYDNEDINAGWNQSSWDNLRNVVGAADVQDAIIGIMLWSSPMIEAYEGRWATHLWNQRNGGPIADDGDGKDEFYTLDSYGTEISGPYNSSWSWQKKNQFRQEELVKKYLGELAGFHNVYYIPMFEIGDFWGSSEGKAHQWHQHIAGLIKRYQPNRLIATVTGSSSEKVLGSWSEVDFLLFEGPGVNYTGSSEDIRNNFWSFNKPLVWQFIYTGKENPEQDMRDAVIRGLQPATELRNVTSSQVNYALAIANFMQTVENWCDEPGQEITSEGVPSLSGGSGVDLPHGSCNDSGDSAGNDRNPPLAPQGVKVEKDN